MSSESALGSVDVVAQANPDNVCSRCAGDRLAHSGMLRWQRFGAALLHMDGEVLVTGDAASLAAILSGHGFRRDGGVVVDYPDTDFGALVDWAGSAQAATPDAGGRDAQHAAR
jgi:hypothetical protein